ncbi:HalOD1 output domain-containing protein [Natronorubrum sp. DTA28]|uniref:HalOD1 output domain-containing protein n=1 Tax=Natronorubrum sp. DTA28 TaxID=3447019 RepID=UPI003F84A425
MINYDSKRDRPTDSQPDAIIVDVVEALAEADRLELEEVEYTLYEYINPMVLTELANHDTGTWTFRFEIADHEVTVTSDGRLFVDGILCRDDLLLERSSTCAYR